MTRRELTALCHVKPGQSRALDACLDRLLREGGAVESAGRLYHPDFLALRKATVTRLNRTFGFIRFCDGEQEDAFVPGKFFLGALPGDTVLAVPSPSRDPSRGLEGKIVRILEEGKSTLTGTLCQSETGWLLRPDSLVRFDFPLAEEEIAGCNPGDKLLCEVVKRGKSHSDHVLKVIKNYGSAQTAVNCAQALLELNGIPACFPDAVKQEAEAALRLPVTDGDRFHRLDLREQSIFTIDSAESKDLDDAVSLTRTETGYTLGVHIADVSRYVTAGSALDEDAFARGTSIYFADRVVPMLPPELSNGVCSLNPGEDKLTFSCVMELDKEGNRLKYRFERSIIRSRVKGVYSEINSILDRTAPESLLQKYEGLCDSIFLMKELADILTARKRSRGTPEIETSESAILLNEASVACDIFPRERGASEVIIEEFMLSANEAAANFARKRELPFIYRVHEPPVGDRLENLRLVLNALGINASAVKPDLPPSVLAGLLREAAGKPFFNIVNMQVLRAMSKAKYLEKPIGHYGLALEDYAHFTSPIRRYPDLAVHRILGDALRGDTRETLKRRYEAFAVTASRQSSERELNAMMLERNCEDCYKAEYMKAHVGEEFEARISSLAPHGLYVELENTVEGLVKADSLPEGQYDFDGLIEYKNLSTGQAWRIGDTVSVKCTGADVSAGNVDFILL